MILVKAVARQFPPITIHPQRLITNKKNKRMKPHLPMLKWAVCHLDQWSNKISSNSQVLQYSGGWTTSVWRIGSWFTSLMITRPRKEIFNFLVPFLSVIWSTSTNAWRRYLKMMRSISRSIAMQVFSNGSFAIFSHLMTHNLEKRPKLSLHKTVSKIKINHGK